MPRKSLCLGLDIWVPKLVEAENEAIPVEAENEAIPVEVENGT